jgi:hypothetical protein
MGTATLDFGILKYMLSEICVSPDGSHSTVCEKNETVIPNRPGFAGVSFLAILLKQPLYN